MTEKHKEPSVIKIRRSTFWKGLTIVLLVALIVILVYAFRLMSGPSSGGSGVQEKAAQQAQPAQAAQPRQAAPSAPSSDMTALIDDDTIKGSADAPVTIIEWSDFECPFCARFYEQTLGQIIEDYIETGKVKFVYRDFPLNSIHPNAQKAAEAAECADEQGKFWEMHDMLFEKGVSGGVASFKQYAEDLGLDTAEFNDCLGSGKMALEVAKDMRDGQAMGIGGTPGFIINENLVTGAQPFSVFKQVIEGELAK